jgi:SlyX protein
MSNERVDRLEERVAWLERHLTAQDKAMLELHEEIERLRIEVGALRLRIEPSSPGDEDRFASDERPPHY